MCEKSLLARLPSDLRSCGRPEQGAYDGWLTDSEVGVGVACRRQCTLRSFSGLSQHAFISPLYVRRHECYA